MLDDVYRGMGLAIAHFGQGYVSRAPIHGVDVGATFCLNCMTVHENPLVTNQVFVNKCRVCTPNAREIPFIYVELDDIYEDETGLNPYVLYGILFMLSRLVDRNGDVILPSGVTIDYTTL